VLQGLSIIIICAIICPLFLTSQQNIQNQELAINSIRIQLQTKTFDVVPSKDNLIQLIHNGMEIICIFDIMVIITSLWRPGIFNSAYQE